MSQQQPGFIDNLILREVRCELSHAIDIGSIGTQQQGKIGFKA